MDLGLKDKVAMVVGASRGLGKAIASTLADEGCNLALCARGEGPLLETAAELEEKGVDVLLRAWRGKVQARWRGSDASTSWSTTWVATAASRLPTPLIKTGTRSWI